MREGEDGRVKIMERSLGKVSVVHIDRAVVSQESCEFSRLDTALGTAWRIFLMGRRWPMTPVDMTRVVSGDEESGSSPSRHSTMRVASSSPPFPVTAFAQPELIITDLIPSPERFLRMFRLTVTGAAWKMFCVNTAAADAGLSDVRSARSGKRVLDAFTPTWVPETRNPLGYVPVVGTCFCFAGGMDPSTGAE